MTTNRSHRKTGPSPSSPGAPAAKEKPDSDEFDASRFGRHQLTGRFLGKALQNPLPKERAEDLWQDTLPPSGMSRDPAGRDKLPSRVKAPSKPYRYPFSRWEIAAALLSFALAGGVVWYFMVQTDPTKEQRLAPKAVPSPHTIEKKPKELAVQEPKLGQSADSPFPKIAEADEGLSRSRTIVQVPKAKSTQKVAPKRADAKTKGAKTSPRKAKQAMENSPQKARVLTDPTPKESPLEDELPQIQPK